MNAFHSFYTDLHTNAVAVDKRAQDLATELANSPDELIQQLQWIMSESAAKFAANCEEAPSFYQQTTPQDFRNFLFNNLSELITNVISCAALMRDVAEEPGNPHRLSKKQKTHAEELLQISFDALQQIEAFAETLQ